MSKTVFTIKGVDFTEISRRIRPPEIAQVEKTRFDVLNPGRSIGTTSAGGTIRVMQRGALYNKDGTPYVRECGKPCWWHRHPFDGLAMGIPLKIIYQGDRMSVFVDGIFCSYSCTYAYLLDELERVPARRNPHYLTSKELLLSAFEEEFPGVELVPAKDWRLLKDIGNGDLSLKEFLFGLVGIRLVEHPNVAFHPVTITYDIISSHH